MDRVMIGMSGGVDSSVAACLLKEAGYECVGATMRLYSTPTEESTCCSLDDVEDARAVAYRMGIRHYVFNFTEDFDRKVIQKFVACYEQGLTPNPCIDCNRYLKFDRLLHRAQELGCRWVASGHYARVKQDPESGRFLLYKPTDRTKDQTYFLACLTQEQLSHVLFPLGELTKPQVRQIAEAHGFVTARKRDSQDICFVPDGDYGGFLQRYTGQVFEPGDFLDLQGNVVGQHRGAACYTRGQRKGLGLAMGKPVYVCRKDMARNTVTVGPDEALYSPALRADEWCWYPFETLTEPMRVTVRTRHSQSEQPATVYPEPDGFARVAFDTPQRAVSPGQAVVLYDGDLVIGGGTIRGAL